MISELRCESFFFLGVQRPGHAPRHKYNRQQPPAGDFGYEVGESHNAVPIKGRSRVGIRSAATPHRFVTVRSKTDTALALDRVTNTKAPSGLTASPVAPSPVGAMVPSFCTVARYL